MNAVPVRERLLAKLDELNDAQILALLNLSDAMQVHRDDEAAWEEAVLSQSLGDALQPDGSVDFHQLRKTAVAMTLDEFYPEGDADDES